MKIYILDGIGTHNRPDGLVMRQVADAIAAKTKVSEIKWINWPASMSGVGGPLSWVDASRIGVRMLTEEVQSNSEDFILLAYSGGNKPAKDWLYENAELRKRCKAVGLVSDPQRPRDRWQSGTADPGGWGIGGEDYGPIPDRTYWTSVAGDVISSAREDALLRTFAALSDGPPELVMRPAAQSLQQGKMRVGRELEVPFIQWFTTLGRRINEAIVDVQRYFGGWHTTRYTNGYDNGPSLCSRMGASIAWKINNPR